MIKKYTLSKTILDSVPLGSLDRFIVTHDQEIEYEGLQLDFSSLRMVEGPSDWNDFSPSFVLVIDTLSCDLCVEEEASFFEKLGKKIGDSHKLWIVFAAESNRLARVFARTYEIKATYLFDAGGQFIEDHRLAMTPVVLVCNSNRQVQNAHIPVPEHFEWNSHFYHKCLLDN
jgi:hypothetical protein